MGKNKDLLQTKLQQFLKNANVSMPQIDIFSEKFNLDTEKYKPRQVSI